MSSTSLEDLNAQIKELEAQRAQLQAEAGKQRKEAIASEVQQLIEKIATYGITAKELGLTDRADKPKRAGRPQRFKVAHDGKTFTGPEGQTWTEGTRGRKPAWLVQQLSELAE